MWFLDNLIIELKVNLRRIPAFFRVMCVLVPILFYTQNRKVLHQKLCSYIFLSKALLGVFNGGQYFCNWPINFHKVVTWIAIYFTLYSCQYRIHFNGSSSKSTYKLIFIKWSCEQPLRLITKERSEKKGRKIFEKNIKSLNHVGHLRRLNGTKHIIL